MRLSLASIHVYPIKSLGGFQVDAAQLTDRGLEHDRRWMLVDTNGCFISQREIPVMACLHCSPLSNGSRVTDVRDGTSIDLPWTMDRGDTHRVKVWDDDMSAIAAGTEIGSWFSKKLGLDATLVFMPEMTERKVDPRYAEGLTSFSDGFPYLIVSQTSLVDLNERMAVKERVGMDRFRPNIVIAGGNAYQEDEWKSIVIGDVPFELVKPCARCMITTTDQRTGSRGKEPLRTLALYRKSSGAEGAVKVDFAMNAVGPPRGSIHVGDMVQVLAGH